MSKRRYDDLVPVDELLRAAEREPPRWEIEHKAFKEARSIERNSQLAPWRPWSPR